MILRWRAAGTIEQFLSTCRRQTARRQIGWQTVSTKYGKLFFYPQWKSHEQHGWRTCRHKDQIFDCQWAADQSSNALTMHSCKRAVLLVRGKSKKWRCLDDGMNNSYAVLISLIRREPILVAVWFFEGGLDQRNSPSVYGNAAHLPLSDYVVVQRTR